MKRRSWTALLVAGLALVAAPGCGGDDDRASDAATWRTWVLRSPAELSPRGPAVRPRSEVRPAAATGEPSRRWADGPSVEPWFRLAMEFVAARTKDPPAGSRAYAMVGVAAYDAAVSAAHWRREQGEAGGPSEDAAIAGAASRVLWAAFPEHPKVRLDALAEEAAAAAVARGDTTTAGADAGLRLGRLVAERVVAHVESDHPERPARRRPPAGAGAWAPPPGSTARPVQPGAGTWTTWLLPSGDAFRPAPPPRYGSARFMEEIRELVRIKEKLTPEQERIARFWEGGEGTELPPGIWVRAVLAHLRDQGVDGVRAARAMALVTTAMADAGVAAWDAKYAYWLTRPENAIRDLLDPSWRPLLDTPFFPAYPSGHSVYSAAAAEVLAHLFPEEAATWRRRAQEASMSRLYGGIHYRVDHEAGMRLGRRVGRLAVRRAHRDGAGR